MSVCSYKEIQYTAEKMNELWLHTALWMNLKNIMLSRKSRPNRLHIVQFIDIMLIKRQN